MWSTSPATDQVRQAESTVPIHLSHCGLPKTLLAKRPKCSDDTKLTEAMACRYSVGRALVDLNRQTGHQINLQPVRAGLHGVYVRQQQSIIESFVDSQKKSSSIQAASQLLVASCLIAKINKNRKFEFDKCCHFGIDIRFFNFPLNKCLNSFGYTYFRFCLVEHWPPWIIFKQE